MNHLRIRKPVPSDAHFINAYWADMTEEDLFRLGELQWPDPEENIAFLNWFCSNPIDPRSTAEDLRIWCVDDKTVGYSTLKEIGFGREAQIHLHLSRPYWGKGIGSILFCLSAQDFFDNYELQNLYCQPRSENPMPNKMFEKVGFERIGAVDFVRSDGSVVKQNRYEIDRATIARHLANLTG